MSPAGVGERGDGPGTAQPLPPEGTDRTMDQDGKQEPLDQVVGPSLTAPHRISPPTPGLTVGTHPNQGGVCGAPPGSGVSGGETEDVDPLVAKRRAMQRAKSQRLALYADNSPVTPLHSTISLRARKAFKMPTAARSASPALGRGKTGNRDGPAEKGTRGVLKDMGGETLGRKLSFDEDAERTDGQKREPGTPSMGEEENPSGDRTLNNEQSERSAGKHQTEHSQDTVPKLCDNSERIPSTLSVKSTSTKSDTCQPSIENREKSDTLHLEKRPTRTRGRGKRQFSEEDPEDGRRAKRSASLGTRRSKTNSKN